MGNEGRSPPAGHGPAADPVRHSYAKRAAGYDRWWASYVAATIGQTLSRVQLDGGEALLDVGCGTGTLLDTLSQSWPDLALSGMDLSPEMLQVAAQKLGGRAQLMLGEANALPFADGAFQVLVSTSVFHYLRDPAGALAEFYRVLTPGGRLVITDWCDDYLACRVCSWFVRAWDPSHERILGSAECRQIMAASAFDLLSLERYKINWLWGMMTMIAKKPG